MNYGPLLFLAAFFGLASSWFGFVLMPQVQVGRLQPTNTIPAGEIYPVSRPGIAREGLQVYRAYGCAACHSQQVGQTGTICDVVLTEAGTNREAVLVALRQVRPGLSQAEDEHLLAALPKTVRQGLTKEEAEAVAKDLSVGGAKATVWIVPVGPDIAQGWGKRRTVAEDFLYDSPVMLGSQRIGPDLANVGMRLPDVNWHLLHLYAPRLQVKDSAMPPYRFLFQKRRIERTRSPEALDLPPALAPEPGYEIVPKRQAQELAAYLTSLKANAPLFVAPLSVATPVTSTNAPGTNAPPGSEISTNAPATNAPAK
jgi:cbb3-type cytochrome oxidase cytochrome c subunit